MKYCAHDYQAYATDFVLSHPYCGLILDMGLGKSVITLTALWDLLLDSFDVGESSQFQVMAEKLNLTSMKALINLTFCCQQATVITDFTNLKEIGRDHYMNIHGGCASMEELEQLDGEETAILLIEDNEGTVTRYGVVYDNGMQLSQLYDGKHLPCYH